MPYRQPSRRPSPVQSNHLKTAYALHTNSTDFVERHGINHCPFLSLTFSSKKRTYPIPAAECLTKALHHLKKFSDDWIWVMGLGTNRRLHYHVLFSYPENVRTGIDLDAYRELLSLEQDYDPIDPWPSKTTIPVQERRRQIRAALSSNDALKTLRGVLIPRLHAAGFGHQIALSPIYTDGPTIAGYMEKNYLETVTHRDVFFKGQRLVGYKHGTSHLSASQFAWVAGAPWRKACERIAHAFGLTDYTEMSPTFGPKWGHRVGFLIEALQSRYGRSTDRWPTTAIITSRPTPCPSRMKSPNSPSVTTICLERPDMKIPCSKEAGRGALGLVPGVASGRILESSRCRRQDAGRSTGRKDRRSAPGQSRPMSLPAAA